MSIFPLMRPSVIDWCAQPKSFLTWWVFLQKVLLIKISMTEKNKHKPPKKYTKLHKQTKNPIYQHSPFYGEQFLFALFYHVSWPQKDRHWNQVGYLHSLNSANIIVSVANCNIPVLVLVLQSRRKILGLLVLTPLQMILNKLWTQSCIYFLPFFFFAIFNHSHFSFSTEVFELNKIIHEPFSLLQ